MVLTVLTLVWVAGYILADRMRHKRRPPEPSESLRQCVESSLVQVEHQIWLLRNAFWWYLLPFALSTLTFFGQGAWQEWSGGWWTVLAVAGVVVVVVSILSSVYWVNQHTVRSNLGSRRQELEALLLSLKNELPAVNA